MTEAEKNLEATLEALRGLQAAPSTQKAVQVLQDWDDRRDPHYNASEERVR